MARCLRRAPLVDDFAPTPANAAAGFAWRTGVRSAFPLANHAHMMARAARESATRRATRVTARRGNGRTRYAAATQTAAREAFVTRENHGAGVNKLLGVFVYVAAVACVACGNTSTVDEPTRVLGVSQRSPSVWLFAVDDVADEAGNEMRERVWAGLARRVFSGSCGAPLDPAEYYATDRRAVVMSPSGLGLLGPDSNPKLAVTTPHDTPEVQAAWLDAVHRVVDAGVVAPATSPYAFLSRLSDTVSLLVGARSPTTDSEQRVLESLTGTRELVVVSAAAREDESTEAPESLAIQIADSAGSFSSNTHEVLVFPSSDGQPCYRAKATTDRYSRWLAASSAAFLQLPDLWRPGDDCSFVGVDATCSRACLEQSPRFLPSGGADCHIYVASAPNEGCPESRGLMPSNATVPDVDGPVCEIRQLEGAALESCRHDLQCAACEPGYCFTEVPEVASDCETLGKVAAPRFVNGSANVPSRKVYIYCKE